MNEEIKDVLHHADMIKECPLVAVDASDLDAPLMRLYADGLPPGASTGWPLVDKHYTVAPGQFTVITGWPSSGKSEWLDAMLINLTKQGWHFAMHSAENRPEEVHIAKLIEKFQGLPFRKGPHERMSKEEVREGADYIATYFGFLRAAVGTERVVFTLEHILAGAELYFRRIGSWRSKTDRCGLVIDPWNELEHHRPQHWSETEYVSASLSLVRSWARKNNVHVWIVAHPQKLRRYDNGKLPIPTPDTISGSQHWWNKADNCVTVWRDLEPDIPGVVKAKDKNMVDIYVQKVRFKHIGSSGTVQLRYDVVTGRYSQVFGIV